MDSQLETEMERGIQTHNRDGGGGKERKKERGREGRKGEREKELRKTSEQGPREPAR